MSSSIVILTKLLVLVACYHIVSSLPAPPIVESVRRINASSIHIIWRTLDEHGREAPNRYRIFYSGDNFETDFNEWPAQMTHTRPQLLDHQFTPYVATSTHECWNECLRLPSCVLVAHRFDATANSPNCFVKQVQRNSSESSNNNTTSLPVLNDENSEFVRIGDYKTEAVINGLPAHVRYSFIIGVYYNEWSTPSEITDTVDLSIDLIVDQDQRVNDSVTLFWQQTGAFKDAAISRYEIIVQSAEDPSEQPIRYHDFNSLSRFRLYPDFFEMSSAEDLDAKNEDDCVRACFRTASCVRYVFDGSTRKCSSLSKINWSSSFQPNKNLKSMSIRSSSDSFELTDLEPLVEYKVQVKFTTPYGLTGFSNIITVTRKVVGNESPVDDGSDEEDYKEDDIITVATTTTIPVPVVNETETVKPQAKPDPDEDYDEKDDYVDNDDNDEVKKPEAVRNQDKIPSQPVLINASIHDKKVFLEWDNPGEIPLTGYRIEWSKDFNDNTQPIKYEDVDLSSDGAHQLSANAEIPEESYVRLTLKNDNGFGKPSDPVMVSCLGSECRVNAVRTSEIKRVADKKATTRTYMMVIMILMILLIIIIAIFIIVTCIRRAKKKKADAATTAAGAKYEPVATCDQRTSRPLNSV